MNVQYSMIIQFISLLKNNSLEEYIIESFDNFKLYEYISFFDLLITQLIMNIISNKPKFLNELNSNSINLLIYLLFL